MAKNSSNGRNLIQDGPKADTGHALESENLSPEWRATSRARGTPFSGNR